MIDPIQWDKLEPGGSSEIGVARTEVGTPVYAPAKFGDGVLGNQLTGNYVKYDGLSLGKAFTFSFFVKALSTSAPESYIWNGQTDYSFIIWAIGNVWIVGEWGSGGWLAYYSFPMTYSVDDIFHVGIIFDSDAGAGNRIRLFKDGIEIAHGTIYADNSWSAHTANLYINSYGGAIANMGYTDNIKIYGYSLADFSWDIDNEGLEPTAPATPTGLTASQGIFSNKVAVSWDASAGATEYQLQRALTSGGSYSDISGWQAGLTFDDTTGVVGQNYYYKVKAKNGIGESALSSAELGFLKIPALIKETITRKYPRILLNGIDIYALGFVTGFISIINEKTFQRDKLISDSFELEVDNSTKWFSIDNPISPLHDLPAFIPVQIYDSDDELVFDGYVENISRDYNSQTATLKLTDALYFWAKKDVTYASADWETPAQAFKNICAAVGFTAYDPRSVDISDGIYAAAACKIKVTHSSADPIQFQNLLEDLGRIGVADIFSMNGKIHFKHWKQYAETPPYSVDNTKLKTFPVIQALTEEMANEYSIGYDGDSGTPATDAANGNIGSVSRGLYGTRAYESFDTSSGVMVVKDLASAVYLGECLIRRSHYDLSGKPRPLNQVEFDVPADCGNWVDVDSYYSHTFADESWISKSFEIMRVEKIEDEKTVKIKAYEIPS